MTVSYTHLGATYVAFGGFYPSRVKKYPVTTPLDIVSEWKKEQPDMPVCVIGGMDVEKGAPLVAKGDVYKRQVTSTVDGKNML